MNLTDFDLGCLVGEKVCQLFLKHGGKHPHIVESKHGKKFFFFDEVYTELKPFFGESSISETTTRRIARMTYKSAFEQYERLDEAGQVSFYEMLWNDMREKADYLEKDSLIGYDFQEMESGEEN